MRPSLTGRALVLAYANAWPDEPSSCTAWLPGSEGRSFFWERDKYSIGLDAQRRPMDEYNHEASMRCNLLCAILALCELVARKYSRPVD